MFRSIPRTLANRVRRNCRDDSEFVRDRSEHSNYLLRSGCSICNIDNTFQNIQLISQETLVRTSKENQVKLANAPSKQKCITSFTPTYHSIISEIQKIIRKNLTSAVDSSELLKEILPLDTIKLSSRWDRNLKEILAPSVPYAHRKDREGSCSRWGSQRCVLCKTGILVETNKFCSFTVRFKYRIFRPLNCIFVNVIYKTDCILCKLGYIGSTSKQARTRWAKHKYDIKNSRIEQSGLTDNLHKGVHHNQSFEQKLGKLRMVLIDQVAGENHCQQCSCALWTRENLD